MTEGRKQELRRLLEEAMGSLEIRHQYGPHSIPVEVYRRYLQERWTYYGLDCLSPFWVRFTLDIACSTTKSRLLDCIREELALFIGVGDDTISTTIYLIESNSTDRPSVHRFDSQRIHLDLILMRLLEIGIVRGVEGAMSVFDRCSRLEGVHGFFQDVSLVEEIKLTKDIEVFKGVRLVPLLPSGMSREIIRYLPRFPVYAFIRESSNFSGKTLLVIDRPGFSIIS